MSQIQHLNPPGLPRNPAFTQAVAVSGRHRTIYVGGQDAVDASGNIVGKGDLRAQTEQVFHNMKLVLAAAGAGLEHVVKWTLYVVQGQPLQPGFEAYMKEWAGRPNPPTITMAFVAQLARPEFLVEMDAIAVVPEAP